MKIQVKIENHVFDVEIKDPNARPVIAEIDGELFEVYPEMEKVESAAGEAKSAPVAMTAAPVHTTTPKASSATAGKGSAVTAPIPGVILSVAVKVGDEVKVGQELCVLEAMKMKNAIRANRPGKIAAIQVSSGDHVNHGQLLMEYTD